MASNVTNKNTSNNSSPNESDPNTTYVQADPSSFRAIVQRFTGADPEKISGNSNVRPQKIRPGFNLHERRSSARKLEIELNNGYFNEKGTCSSSFTHYSDDKEASFQCSPNLNPARQYQRSFLGQHTTMVSPVSPLDNSNCYWSSPSNMDDEGRAIAEKGFYLHQTPRGSDPPELLPLFPLQSPRDNNN